MGQAGGSAGDPPVSGGTAPGADPSAVAVLDRVPAPLFVGTYEPRLDDKGRLFLPARFRDALAEGVVIAPGQERCLYVFPAAEFTRLLDQARRAPVTHKGSRDYLRVFLSQSAQETPDRQGRVTVGAKLRDWAGLTKDCAVIGTGAKLEVWDAPVWHAYLAAHETAFAEQDEEVLPGFI